MDNHKLLIYGLYFFASVILIIVGSIFFEEWIRYIEVAGLVGAGSGIIKLVYESNKTRKLKEAEFISQLNRDYITNPHICGLYEKLEHDYRYPQEPSKIEDSDILSFVVYFTFFETLYDFIKKKIIKIENIDDLFGYRFFIMLHNPKIQDVELTNPKIIASYVNIFNLYDIWLKHRIKVMKKYQYKLSDTIVLWEHNLYENHPECLKYIHKPVRITRIDRASRWDIFTIYMIQRRGVKALKQKNQSHLFVPSSLLELYQLIRQKNLFVKRSCFSIEAYIGLIELTKKHKLSQYVDSNIPTLLIDTVFVDVPYRGLGIQKELLDFVLTAFEDDYKQFICTIDPINKVSVKNFQQAGFQVYRTGLTLYHNKNREIWIKS